MQQTVTLTADGQPAVTVGFPSRDAIRRHQLEALRRLIREVATGNRFYAPILRQAGVSESVADLDDFVARMPFTQKRMLAEDQRRNPPFGTNLTYPLAAYCRLNQTSATTHGAPLRWLDTPESWQWMLDNWKQVYRAAGVSSSDRLYFAFSFGPFLGFWTAFEAGSQIGCLTIPGGGLSSLARLEAMRDTGATVLLCTPTYAMRLAEVAAGENLDLSTLSIRKILVAGEPGGSVPAVREHIERRWSRAAIFDHHGMTEVGPVSYQCPEEPGTLVVMESSYLAEVVDSATGRPVRRGAIGELVLTTLGRVGSPLLRYRTGDLVREDVGMAARHGRHEMSLKGGILGRTDDMVLIRGVNVYPAALDEVLRSFAEVAEYRVELQTRRAMTEIHIRVEPTATGLDGPALARQIQAKVRSLFNLRMRVTVCPPGTLPRFEMKAQRWVREAVAEN
ncbi:MAG: phenylacetate--CoA ligase family protein [Thermoguttaceae bacterium]